MDIDRRTALLAGVLVGGFLAGTIVGGAFLGSTVGADTTGVDPANPPTSVTTATGCAGHDQRAASGWLVEATATDGVAVTFNQTYVGVENANATLRSSPETRTYTLVVTTDGEQSTAKQGQPADCRAATSVQASATLPEDYSLSIVRDGETVLELEDDGETPTRVLDLDERNATG